MGLEIELDLTDYKSPEQAEAGEFVKPGWYRAVVSNHVGNDEKGEYRLEFTVQGGVYDGKKISYYFADPRFMDDDDKIKKAKARIRMIASRLGLISDDAYGNKANLDFDNAVNRPAVIEVEANTYDLKDDMGNVIGQKKNNRISYAGIYPPDHLDIPQKVRAELKLPAAKGKASAGGGRTAAATQATGAATAAAPAADPWAGL